MGPEYITYKNIAVFSRTQTQTAAGATIFFNVPAINIIPTKNLLILTARLSFLAQLVTGEFLPNCYFQGLFTFPEPGASGIIPAGSGGTETWNITSGTQFEMSIHRTIPAGYSWSLVHASGRVGASAAPGANWQAYVTVAIFYVLMN